MKIAKIVSSRSHIEYIARIIDAAESPEAPSTDDYGFGHFVSVNFANEKLIGVIANSAIIAADYENYGPRVSGNDDLAVFSPDLLDERGTLVNIILLGNLTEKGGKHGVPRRMVAPGEEVFSLSDNDLQTFHMDSEKNLHLTYYSQIIAHGGNFAVPLLEQIIENLSTFADEANKKRLELVRQSLTWQRTVGAMRL